jgi:starch phosphorylase
MKPIKTFNVTPSIPRRISGLHELAYNLRWAWNHDTLELFRRLDPQLWEETEHNPAEMLGRIDQRRLNELTNDDGFLAHYDRVIVELQIYISTERTWFKNKYKNETREPLFAYFSAEFGLTECLKIYSGGLGILAGDHLKSASDLDVPLVGVGLLYQQGYFKQYLNEAGWQQETYQENDFFNLPIELQTDKAGKPVTIKVEYPGRDVHAQIWKVEVGRIGLYLLDTNFDANSSWDRDICDRLYSGDSEMRLKQEMMLGIGGIRALHALGLQPKTFHMNEGHSAFLGLERLRDFMHTRNLSFEEASAIAKSGQVFTTHTPVAAGHDYFTPELMRRYFEGFAASLGLNFNDFMALGRKDSANHQEPFCMTVLAIRLSSYRNGVSKLHGDVSRKMWARLWPELPENEIPITHITNGVHSSSWISKDMAQLFDRYLGPRWRDEPGDQSVWRKIEVIPPVELWDTHKRQRERLIAFARARLKAQLKKRGYTKAEMEAADEVLDPNILTIGFARRFATYKRATLLLQDEARLTKLLTDWEKPIQIVFAGKAHPQDEPGKELIRKIIKFARREEVRSKIVFIENYNIDVGRYLYQGVDVWLNTPVRPHEASGTSGMKAAFNGAINLSILDGWWDEAFNHDTGWAIGRGESYADEALQNEVEANSLYAVIEKDIIPAFYQKGRDGIPREWVALMKSSMVQLCPFFNTNRMVQQYTTKFYVPAMEKQEKLVTGNAARVKELAQWQSKVRRSWSKVKIDKVDTEGPSGLNVGDVLKVSAQVELDGLSPDDIAVQLYFGKVNAKGEFSDPITLDMEFIERLDEKRHVFANKTVHIGTSGHHGFTVRIVPKSEEEQFAVDSGLVVWAG